MLDVRTVKRLRTREKECLQHYNLTLDIMQLQQEIHQYKTLREVLTTRALLDQKAKAEALLATVNHYYDAFRYGINTPTAAQRELISKDIHYNQADFLKSIMDPHLVIGPFRGAQVLIDQWGRYAEYLPFLQLELVSVDIVDMGHQPILKTIGDCTFRLTRRSVVEIFPHILHNDAIVLRLVGLKVRFHCATDFFFKIKGLIGRLKVRMEFFLALSKVFKDPKKLMEVMSQAKIMDEFFLGDLTKSSWGFVGAFRSAFDAPNKKQSPLV